MIIVFLPQDYKLNEGRQHLFIVPGIVCAIFLKGTKGRRKGGNEVKRKKGKEGEKERRRQ